MKGERASGLLEACPIKVCHRQEGPVPSHHPVCFWVRIAIAVVQLFKVLHGLGQRLLLHFPSSSNSDLRSMEESLLNENPSSNVFSALSILSQGAFILHLKSILTCFFNCLSWPLNHNFSTCAYVAY